MNPFARIILWIVGEYGDGIERRRTLDRIVRDGDSWPTGLAHACVYAMHRGAVVHIDKSPCDEGGDPHISAFKVDAKTAKLLRDAGFVPLQPGDTTHWVYCHPKEST